MSSSQEPRKVTVTITNNSTNPKEALYVRVLCPDKVFDADGNEVSYVTLEPGESTTQTSAITDNPGTDVRWVITSAGTIH